jgi:hypothetical protein
MMSINNSTELRAAIERLELKKKSEEKELIVHFHETVEHLKPANRSNLPSEKLFLPMCWALF